MSVFDYEEYEAYCVAMAMIEAAVATLRNTRLADDGEGLTDLLTRINEERLRLLGNGLGRPYHVAELVRPQETPHD